MKLLIDKHPLSVALKSVSSVTGSGAPVMSHVLIEAKGALRLTCTDGDMWGSTTVSADIQAQGALCVPCDALLRYVDSLPDGAQVSLAQEEGRDAIRVRCGRSNALFGALPPDHFPVFDLSDSEGFSIPAADLRRLFSRTVDACMKKDDVRVALKGVHLRTVNGGTLVAEACDTAVLFRQQVKCDAEVPPVIIPAQSVKTILRALGDGDATLSVNPAWICVTSGNTTLKSKLIAESFPDIARLLAFEFQTTATMQTAGLKKTMTRLLGIASDKDRTLRIDFKDAALSILTRDDVRNSGEDEVAAEIEGEPWGWHFNAQILSRLIAPVAADKTVIRVPSVNPGGNIMAFDATDDGWVGLATGFRG